MTKLTVPFVHDKRTTISTQRTIINRRPKKITIRFRLPNSHEDMYSG